MPAHMLRWRLLRITILLLGSVTSAWAADPPLCPSSLLQPDQSASVSSVTSQPRTARPASGKSPALGLKLGATEGAIDITADHASAAIGKDEAVLQGNVSVHQGDREIHADEVHYNTKTNGIKTDGNIEYQDPVVHLTGVGGTYSPSGGADFKSAQFDLRQRAARGSADTLRLTPKGVIDLKGVKFTTCPETEEAWRIRANSVTLDTTTRIGEARSARVEFKDVPILYLPWLSFPLSNERKSGFLYPTIGNSSRSGVELAVPYYWNIAPNADLTFQPIEYSRRGIDVGGDLRYMNASDHGEIVWNYLPTDSLFGSSRSRIKLLNTLELPAGFRFSINAESVSDTSYFEDFSQGPEGTSTAFLQQTAAITYRDEHWKIDAEAQHYQTIDITDVMPDERPYARLPRLAASADYSLGPAQELKYGFESEIVNFSRSINFDRPAVCQPSFGLNPCVTGWRVDVMPETSLNFDGPAYFVRPGVAWRLTQYELSNTGPGELRSPSRTLPIASFDTGLFFERDSGSQSQRKLTLEPRVLYLYAPYRNQDQLPVFDTALPDLDPVELFRNNRYVGADRVSDANQVSVGLTSRLLDAHDGRQFLSATIGQTFYFTTPRVLLPNEIPRTDGRSDFVAQVALTAYRHWSADLGLQWDPQASRAERAELNIQYKPSPGAVINVGYRYQRDFLEQTQIMSTPATGLPPTVVGTTQTNGLEQTEVSAAWPINRQWNLFVRDVYSIKDHTPLEEFAGFEYGACCWRARLGARSFVSNRDGSKETGVYLQLELTGLASVGSESDSFLTESIRGYVPADAQKLRAP
jgi:LPS-assembly protein